MGNLGGHDLPSLLDAFDAAGRTTGPSASSPTRSRAIGLPLAGHKDNHAGLMTPAQVEILRGDDGARGPRMGAVRGPRHRRTLRRFLAAVPFVQRGRAASRRRRRRAGRSPRQPADPCRRRRRSACCCTSSPRATASSPAHRDDLARRHGLDQSRRLGQPPRPVRARGDGRRVQGASASPPPSTGTSRRRASISNSASPR